MKRIDFAPAWDPARQPEKMPKTVLGWEKDGLVIHACVEDQDFPIGLWVVSHKNTARKIGQYWSADEAVAALRNLLSVCSWDFSDLHHTKTLSDAQRAKIRAIASGEL